MKNVPVPTVLAELRKLYTPPRTFLNHESPFQLLIATILSAQCTDAMVNRVTPALFQKYRKPEDLVKVSREELQKDIHSCGHYRNKAKYLQESSRLLLEKFQGEVPRSMDELTQLPGVGRKTAAVIMYAAFGEEGGLAVDTHVWRVSKRLGLSRAKSQDKIELDLMEQTPQAQWGELHTLLIMHGRGICTARNRQCEKCPFQKECPSSRVEGREDWGKK